MKMARRFLILRTLYIACCLLTASCEPNNQEVAPDGKVLSDASDDISDRDLTAATSNTELISPRNRKDSGFGSAVSYNDQMLRNFFQGRQKNPLNYAQSYFLTLFQRLGRRPTRFSDWDSHSVMHFGKRSLPDEEGEDYLEKSVNDSVGQEAFTDNESIERTWFNAPLNEDGKLVDDAIDFEKKSETSWDNHNTMHFGKKDDDTWHNMMSFGKRSENPWYDHSTLHFGKKEDPWHNMMSFGKRDEAFWKDHNTMHFGKRGGNKEVDEIRNHLENNADSELKAIRKRSLDISEPNEYEMENKRYDVLDHNTLHFGKKSDSWDAHNTLHFGKKTDPSDSHNMMYFGKKFDPSETHNMLYFGKKSSPWESHSTIHFGKKSWNDHNTMHFGKKSSAWDLHNTMHFGKRFSDKDYHNTMHFGKKNKPDNLKNISEMPDLKYGENNIDSTHSGERENLSKEKIIMKRSLKSANERSSNNIKHLTVEISKDNPMRYKPKQNIKIDQSDSEKKPSSVPKTIDKTQDKNSKSQSNVQTERNRSKRSIEEAISVDNKQTENEALERQFADTDKRFDESWNHNTLHFGKKDYPWQSHNTMHFGKKSYPLLDHSTLHFGKRFEPWENHNTMHFGKKWDEWNNHDTLHFGKRPESWDSQNTMNPGKRPDSWNDHSTLHFGKKSTPWEDHATLHFGKRQDSWGSHSTLHFGKKSDLWNNHNTMHFGKRSDAWDNHNTLHFGKRPDSWENHNTMHFGKRSDAWEDHNTMHFGKRNLPFLIASLYHKPNVFLASDNFSRDDESSKDKTNEDENEVDKDKEKYENLLRSFRPIIQLLRGNSEILPEPIPYERNDLEEEPFQMVIESKQNEMHQNPMIDQSLLPIVDIYHEDANYDDIPNSDTNSEDGKLIKPAASKRYLVPFQGAKSIVFPHAWFASQIRRSAMPKAMIATRSFATKTEEKKEDPVNSYMHFGRR